MSILEGSRTNGQSHYTWKNYISRRWRGILARQKKAEIRNSNMTFNIVQIFSNLKVKFSD